MTAAATTRPAYYFDGKPEIRTSYGNMRGLAARDLGANVLCIHDNTLDDGCRLCRASGQPLVRVDVPLRKRHIVETSTMPAIIAGPMSAETVEVMGRVAPHITVVVTESRAERSHVSERPGTVLTPREVVVKINDVSLDYRTPTDLLLLADVLRRGGWVKTADKVHALAGRAGRNLMDGPGLDVPRALRSIAAPLVEYAI